MTDTTHILLHLNLIENIGPETIKKIIERSDLVHLYQMSVQDLLSIGLTEHQAQLVTQGLASTKYLDRELELLTKHQNIKLLTLLDTDYPTLLKTIHAPPVVVYYKGASFFEWQKNIAIIGSRKANSYAQQVITSWVPSLVQSDWSVVSGGALGADTMAHQATVDSGGRTVAILGSGLLMPYPRSNLRLFERIVNCGGALVSPFPLTMDALPGNFPARNRIISGLSSVCLIIQAAKKSGASITAEFALEQGRTVCAVPGSIFDPLHEGCHALIKEGATIVGSLDDLLVELGESKSSNSVHNKAMPSVQPQQMALPLQQESFSPIEQQIVQYCLRGAVATDELLQHIDISLDQLYDELFNLQLTGKIEQNITGCWQVKV